MFMASWQKTNEEDNEKDRKFGCIISDNCRRRQWPVRNDLIEKYESFLAYHSKEEIKARKITGSRQSGGEKEPNFIDLLHEKEARLLRGPPEAAEEQPPSYDRPYLAGPYIPRYVSEEERERQRELEELEERMVEAVNKQQGATAAAATNENVGKVYVEMPEFEDAGDFEDL